MSILVETCVLSARVEFLPQRFLVPMRLSSGLIESITEARAVVRVRVGETEVEGRGAIYLSDLWAWPDPSLSHEERDAVLRRTCEELAKNLPEICRGKAHPLELGLRLNHAVLSMDSPLPFLARKMCASPFDAAIHDAVGQALGISAFDFYNEPVPIPGADGYFPQGACEAIRTTLREPEPALAGWWIAGTGMDLDREFPEAIGKKGFTCFKIKLLGRDIRQDAERTVEVYRVARRCGVERPRISLDSNEANPDAKSVADFLDVLQELDAEAYEAVCYFEQPTGRDIRQAAYDWHEIGARKPVMLDEGLTDFELLALAEKQGWSGFALKTCKGHSFTLCVAAWAHHRGMLLTMQDLTNPGMAAVHSFLVAAHLPVMNGIEINSPQFTPSANEAWMPRMAELFDPRDGIHRLKQVHPVGLGTTL